MKVAILDKQVRRNIALFKHLIEKEARKQERFLQLTQKIYKAFINRKTGTMRFSGLQGEKFPKEEWKAVIIKLHPDGPFEVVAEEGETRFDCDLEPPAYTLFTKTMHILNQLCKSPKKSSNPFWVLRHISQLDFEMTEEEEGKRNLIHDAWHSADREHAEYLLSKKPIGTYLFRKDEFAIDLEESLNEGLPIPVICITLTYSCTQDKICEKTLIYKDGEWLFYNDDPALSGKAYSTVQELLASLGEELKEPLLASGG